MKETAIGNQIWSELLDIEVPGSVKIDGIRYYTYEQAQKAAEKFAELNGSEWRLPIEDFVQLAKTVDYNPVRLIENGFIKTGFCSGDLVYDTDSGGHYWSSTDLDTEYACYMYFNKSGVHTKFINYKRHSYAIRCVKFKKLYPMNAMKQPINLGLTPEKFWVKDIDGNVLKTYRVGKFLITENLKTEHYNDGTPIPIVEDAEEWRKDTSGTMCYYDNDRKHKEKYGALYNFYAVNTGKLAPASFRVLSDEDWKQIEMALGMSKEDADKEGWRGSGIGDKMKEVLGVVFAGYRTHSGGGFRSLGAEADWWSSSVGGTGSWERALHTGYASVYRGAVARSHGFSVRCVRELSESEIRLLDNLTISEEKGNNIEKPQRDEKGRFVKQNKKINMEEKKLQQGTAEPERLSIKERICLKLILLAIKILRPISYESQEIEEIKKML